MLNCMFEGSKNQCVPFTSLKELKLFPIYFMPNANAKMLIKIFHYTLAINRKQEKRSKWLKNVQMEILT